MRVLRSLEARTGGVIIRRQFSTFRPETAMDLSFSPEEEIFRQDVRAFIADAKPKLPDVGATESADRSKEDYLAWHKLLYKKGWVAPLWPKEYGGTGWNVTQRYIFNEECANAETPTTLPFGLNMVAPVIFTYGNDEQKGESRQQEGVAPGVAWRRCRFPQHYNNKCTDECADRNQRAANEKGTGARVDGQGQKYNAKC
jgi:alkylation response protein AidB-like acyl-CoA dehydrogenase